MHTHKHLTYPTYIHTSFTYTLTTHIAYTHTSRVTCTTQHTHTHAQTHNVSHTQRLSFRQVDFKDRSVILSRHHFLFLHKLKSFQLMIESKVYTCPYINHLQNSLSLEVSYKTFIFWQCCLLGLIEVLGKLEVTSSGRNGWVAGSGSRLPHRESWRSAWRHHPINLLKVCVFHKIKRNLDWWASKPQQEPSLAGWSPRYSTNSSVNKDKDVQKTVVNRIYFSAEFLEGHFLRLSFNCVICLCYLYSLCLCLRKGNHSSCNFLMCLWFILSHKLYNLRTK